MILRKITLKNFLIHEDTQLEFSPNGITAIIGENGSGKSSIIEAIQFAFFGDSDKGDRKDLVKWGRKQAKVELEFETKDGLYKVIKEINKTGKNVNTNSEIYIYENGRFRPYYQKEVNKVLPKITRLTKKTFFTSVLIKQGEIEGILREKPSERKKIIEDLLNINLYRKIQDQFKENQKRVKTRLDILQEDVLKIDKNQIQQYLEELNNQLEHLSKDYENLNQKLNNIKQKLKEIENQEKQASYLQSEIGKLEESIKNIKANIENYENQLKEIESLKTKFSELESKFNQLENLEKTNQFLSQIEKLIITKESKEESIKQFKEDLKFLESFKDKAKEFEEKQNSLKQIESKLTELNQIKGEISQLNKQIEKINLDIQKKKQEYTAIVDNLTKIYQKFQTLKLNPLMIKEYKEANKLKLQQLEKKTKELEDKLSQVRTEGKALRESLESIQKLEGKCPTCLRTIEEHQKEELIKELQPVIEVKRKEYKELDEKLKSLKEEKEKQDKIKELLTELEPIYKSIKEKEDELKQAKEKLSIFTHKLKNEENLRKQKEEIDQFIKEHQKYYGVFKNLQSKNIQESYENLNKEIKELSEKINSLLKQIDFSTSSKEEIEIKLRETKEKIEELKPFREEYLKAKQKIEEENKIKENEKKFEAELENKNKKLLELREKLDKIELDKLLNEKEFLKKEEDNYQKELLELSGKIGSLKNEINNYEKSIEELKSKEQEIETLKIKLKKYDKAIESIDYVCKVLEEKALYLLPKYTEELFEKFGFTQFSRLRFTEKYDIIFDALEVGASNIEVHSEALSGGQRIALAIALRLAIARLFNEKTDFLILDEPTIHLDQERKRELIDLLGDFKEKNFLRQLIVITHDEEVEDRADLIYKVNKGRVEVVE